MPYLRYIRCATAAFLTLSLLVVAGCTDRMLTEPQEEMAADPSTSDVSKLRYGHLLKPSDPNSKRVLDRYGDISTDTDFIVGVSSTVLEPQRVLDRYQHADGVTVERSFENTYPGFSIHVDADALEEVLRQIEEDDDVAWVEPDPRLQRHPSITNINYTDGEHLPWGVDFMDADHLLHLDALDLTRQTEDVHVFVLDSGLSSPDLNVCEVRSFVSKERSKGDKTGHGTHIAGTIGAKDNHEGVVGVAPDACLHDYRVMDKDGTVQLSTVIEAVDHITRLKTEHPSWPMVVNISLGADVGSTEYNALDEAIQASIEAGVIYVIAAGNEGIDARTVTPAHVEEAITVGAHNDAYQLSSFSNHGAIIDILAPGTDIVSLPSTALGGKRLTRMSGTSSAAAHVSGAIANYLALKDPSASTETIMGHFWILSRWDIHGIDGTTNRRIYVGNLPTYLDDWY